MIKSMATVRRRITPKQENLAHEIVKNAKRSRPLNKAQLLENAGYSKSVAQANPQDIIDQKGVQIALKDLGFTEDNAKRVVAKILHNESSKDADRLHAAEQVFKVHGSYAPEKRLNATVNINELEALINAQIQQFRGLVEPNSD